MYIGGFQDPAPTQPREPEALRLYCFLAWGGVPTPPTTQDSLGYTLTRRPGRAQTARGC